MQKKGLGKQFICLMVLLLMVTALAGCADMEMELELKDDNSGKYSISLALDQETMDKYSIEAKDLLTEVIEDSNELVTENVEYTKDDKEYKGIKAYFEFDSIEDMQNKLNKVFGTVINGETGHKVPKYNVASCIFQEKDFWKTTTHINIPVENISGQQEEVQSLPDIGVNVTFSLSLPGEVIGTNALNSINTMPQLNNLVWNIDKDTEAMSATYITSNKVLGVNVSYIVIGLAVVFILSVCVVITNNKRKHSVEDDLDNEQ